MPRLIPHRPWNTTTLTWTAVDDRVRGGSSQSYLDAIPPTNTTQNSTNAVRFYGTLDTSTLGGAGFASRSTKALSNSSNSGPTLRPTANDDADTGAADDKIWDLSDYTALRLTILKADSRIYTLTLKDNPPAAKRADGRERAAVSWEVDFYVLSQKSPTSSSPPTFSGTDSLSPISARKSGEAWSVTLPFSAFRATYRGKDMPDAKPLRTSEIRRFGLMMRSFFEREGQAGEFEIVLGRLEAVR